MTKRIRPFVQSLGAAALVAGVFMFQACGGGDNVGMTGNGTGTAGTTGSGTGTAGTTGDAGTSGTAGTTGAGGSATGGTAAFGEPACLSTVVKGGACLPTDQQFCYKTCGPEKTGVKTETCTTAGTYAEMSGCSFEPSRDFSCYKIPTTAQTACPAGVTPQGTGTCDVPHCTLCNSLQGVVGGSYLDSGGAPKVGWCTCQEPNGDGLRQWTCASDTAWPCPLGAGC
jgi:hypothetical protein